MQMILTLFCTGCQGVVGISVNWGAWTGSGMAAKAGIERLERLGFGGIRPEAGAAALGALLRSLGGNGGVAVPQLMGSVFYWDRSAFSPR